VYPKHPKPLVNLLIPCIFFFVGTVKEHINNQHPARPNQAETASPQASAARFVAVSVPFLRFIA
jgi:hypothetical protein